MVFVFLVSSTWGADFCAWRANPQYHSVLQDICVSLQPRCRGVHSCTRAGQSLSQAMAVGSRRGSGLSQSVAPAHPDPNNASYTAAPMSSFLSELSLSVPTLDSEFKAVQVKVGSVSWCYVQLTLRRSLWWSWEWILD